MFIVQKNGFSLIEVMITLGVLSLGIVGMLVMQASAIKGNSTANTITEASAWAGDYVERLFLTPYSNVTAGSENSTDGKYALTWNVTENVTLNGTKTILVTVKRTERGVERSVDYMYVKSDLDVE